MLQHLKITLIIEAVERGGRTGERNFPAVGFAGKKSSDLAFSNFGRYALMMKSVEFETRERSRDGGSASPASLGVEMITHLDVETAIKCCQIK